jgi:predicted  nucleic acid-binding Zn-ribbon protein
MGFDIVGAMSSSYGVLVLLLLSLVLLLWRSGFFRRLYRVIEEMMFSNWQLALLGATAVALSLASGYTTFDGLRNFTSAPLLSVLIAFGIQGVMLIVAWLIGESFATGMNQQIPRGGGFSAREAVIGMGLGVALVGLVFYWVLSQSDAIGFTRSAGAIKGFHADWSRFADVALYFTMALVLLGLVVFGFRRGSDISVPYVQSVRLIAKNAVLWVMFLASMTASVFFSFDSHFNAIFPADARKRAAEIRTLNQVGAVVADIGERAQKVQIAEAERLFDTDGWKAYDDELAKLAAVARGAQAEIEAFLVQKLEERQRGIGEQQERIAGAERNQTALLRKRDELEAELQRIEPSIGALEAELAKAQATYNETRQAIAAKRIDASAEDGGVEGTLKRGKGPVWRQRMAELDELQRKISITDEPRLRDAQRQRDLASARIVSLKRELATITGEVAKYKGQIFTAEQRIKTAQVQDGDGDGGRIDPARALLAFERARAAFRQNPDTEKLAAVQAQCGSLVGAMSAAPATKEKVRGADCDPKHAAEAAARVFALNAGLVAFQTNCAGGSKLPQSASTDELLSFGRKCLQDSGLVSKESTDLGARLQSIEMNRDDKAHRFVVTWNAFLDGNRLGYLALVLAIGVDALVFMAGLFGAAAVKSPLSDVPSPKARSAEQLESIVKNALGEDRLENAELVLAAMKPMRGDAGHRSELDLTHYDPETARKIRKVLVAGASIGAVERAATDGRDERYLVRSELFEYLSVVANTARESDREYSNRARLIQIVGVALEPDRQGNAETVLQHIEPVNRRNGFMAEVDLKAVPDAERRLVQNVLNAGMTVSAVMRNDGGGAAGSGLLARVRRRPAQVETTFLVHSDLFKTLLLYRAGASASVAAERPLAEAPPIRASLGPSRVPVRPDHLLTNGRSGNGLAHRSDAALAERFRHELMTAMALTPTAVDGIWQPEIAELALAAATVLRRQARNRLALSTELRLVESDLRQALEQEQDAIAARYDGDSPALALLRELAAEIGRRIPALMLLPEARLIERLIFALEEAHAEDRLSDEEHLLLSRLQKLKGDLERMNPKDSSAWRSIARQLERLAEPAVSPTHPAEDGKHH